MGDRPGAGAARLEGRRQLRAEATPSERALWLLLRDRRLGGAKARRQHPLGPYVLDFYFPVGRLAVELDGSQHDTVEGREYDTARTAYLAARGVRLLRFANAAIRHERERVLDAIAAALNAPAPPP